jgi:hypothetical protein
MLNVMQIKKKTFMTFVARFILNIPQVNLRCLCVMWMLQVLENLFVYAALLHDALRWSLWFKLQLTHVTGVEQNPTKQ